VDFYTNIARPSLYEAISKNSIEIVLSSYNFPKSVLEDITKKIRKITSILVNSYSNCAIEYFLQNSILLPTYLSKRILDIKETTVFASNLLNSPSRAEIVLDGSTKVLMSDTIDFVRNGKFTNRSMGSVFEYYQTYGLTPKEEVIKGVLDKLDILRSETTNRYDLLPTQLNRFIEYPLFSPITLDKLLARIDGLENLNDAFENYAIFSKDMNRLFLFKSISNYYIDFLNEFFDNN
jgi:hypothetical protein